MALETKTFYLTKVFTNLCEVASVNSSYPYSNAFNKGISNTTYAEWSMVTGSTAYTRVYYGFDTSTLPENAIIQSVTCKVKAQSENDGILKAGNDKIKLFSGTSEIEKTETSGISTITTDAAVIEIPSVGWNREELNDVRLYIQGTRGTSDVNTAYYMRLYGAELTISYMVPSTGQSEIVVINSTGYTGQSNISSSSGLSNPQSGSSGTSAAYFNGSSGTLVSIYWTFDCSSIPEKAIINSVVCKAKAKVYNASNHTNTYLQLYSGTTPKSNTVSYVSTTETVYTLTADNFTREELQNVRLYQCVQSTGSTTTRRRAYFYGADLTIEYTYKNEKFILRMNGSWNEVLKVYKKVNGSWVEQTDLINVIDTSKKLVSGIASSSGGNSDNSGSSPSVVNINVSYNLNGATIGSNMTVDDFASVKINNTEYYQGNFTVASGSSLVFKIYSWTSNVFDDTYGYITINGQKKFTMSQNDGDTETYTWTIPNDVASVNIVFNFVQEDETAAYTYAVVTTTSNK